MTTTRPLARLIPTRPLSGLRPAPSILAIGTSALGSYEQAAPVYDAFFEAGGNFFDTAWVYGQSFNPGCCERALGKWLRTRGVRDDVVLFAKGGHPPYCDPGLLRRQLLESCDRLGVARVDLYMPHRDDLARTVAEFTDACIRIVSDGLTQAYGFSNWSLSRVDAALRYARRQGLPAPVAVSNQFSLLRMERPVYPGCVSARGRAWRDWLAGHEIALVAWSSQARGLHAGHDAPARLVDSPQAGSWYSEGNVVRLERTEELARRRGVRPVNAALAWVLHQPFTVFPVIGPRLASEVEAALSGLDLDLSPAERAWLNPGDGPR